MSKTKASRRRRAAAQRRQPVKGAGAARSARLRAQQRKRQRRQRLVVVAAAAALIVVAAVGITAVVIGRGGPTATAATDLSAVATFDNGAGHTTAEVTYEQSPPAGGEHNPVWLNCGTYAEPVTDVNAVHAMEHGAVWITYRPDLPAADVATLAATTKGQSYEILSPYTDLPAPVVVSAWNKQLHLTGANDRRLQSFIKEFKLGAGAPEPGAPCTGGTGTPSP